MDITPYSELIRYTEGIKFYRAAIMDLGTKLPADDAALDALLAEVVATRNEKAFTHLIYAALAAKRTVDSRHLVEGGALFPDPGLLGNAAWHCSGNVAEALVRAVKTELMGTQRDVWSFVVAAFWCKAHPEFPLPQNFTSEARITARNPFLGPMERTLLLRVAQLTGDEGIRKALGMPLSAGTTPAQDDWRKDPLLTQVTPPPLSRVPEQPPPVMISGFTVRRAVERVGRNDPCPCGSGKKYKKCCYAKDRERLLHSSSVPGVTVEELREQPDLGLSEERIEEMRSYELCKLDPLKIPEHLRRAYVSRLTLFGLLEQATAALEQWPWNSHLEAAWENTVYDAMHRRNRSCLQRLLRLAPDAARNDPEIESRSKLLLAEGIERKLLDWVEAEACKGLNSPQANALVDLTYNLLDSFPALGVVVARGVMPSVSAIEADTLLDHLLRARQELGLPPDDPMCDLVDKLLSGYDTPDAEQPEELREARRNLQAKGYEVSKLQKELQKLQEELKVRETSVPPKVQESSRPAPAVAEIPAIPPPKTEAAPPLEAAPQTPPPPAVDEAVLNGMRERLESLKSQLKERHDERNALRRELREARSQIEVLNKKTSAAAPPEQDAAEDKLLESEEFTGKQSVRLPEFPRKFQESLAAVPQSVARGCLSMVGRLAGGDASAFIGVKRLKSLPDVYRQRVSEDYRLLFRLQPERLEIIDLINRRDLERKIKALS
jgi:hypothetical protein